MEKLSDEEYLEAWRAGFEAEESGAPKNNPHPEGSLLYKAWEKGWDADQ